MLVTHFNIGISKMMGKIVVCSHSIEVSCAHVYCYCRCCLLQRAICNTHGPTWIKQRR